MTKEDFISKVRTKYPEWKKMDDETLYSAVLERYPMYRSQINDGSTPIAEKTMPKEEKPGFFSRAGTALKERFGEIKKTFGEQARGEINPAETGFRVVGDVIAGAGDVIGAAVSPVVEKLAQKEWAKPAFEKLSQGMEFYEEWKNSNETNRRTGEMLESVVNIADLAGVVGGGRAVGKAGVKAGAKVARVGGEATEAVARAVRPVVKTLKEASTEVIPTKSAMISGQITKALDLTAGDVSNIKLATKNDIGDWVANNNLIAKNKKETLSKINSFTKQQYDTVREEISKVPTVYTTKSAPRVKDSLLLLKEELTGVFGQESALKEVGELLKKKKYNLNDVQRVKELLDDQFDLYKATGDVKAGQTKTGLANVRKEIKQFIETEVKNNTGADIRAFNNDVATGRSIAKLAEKRSTRGFTRANVSLSDLGVFSGGSLLGTPLMGGAALFVKRVLESSTVRLKLANFIKKLSPEKVNAVKSKLLKGQIPNELDDVAKQLKINTPAVGEKNLQ